ncbi:MAG TPA: sensor histidine kinase, partial [Ignavibacteria bacterium]|nr:sensor histidine kinase [Ignavibacteria bacterium]
DHILLPVEKAIPIGFIINELVINSLKHAFIGKKTGNILIKIGNINENHVLEVSDNGIGFPENISIDKPKSLGLTILKSLCDQLNSKTEVLNDNGTKFKIIFSN